MPPTAPRRDDEARMRPLRRGIEPASDALRIARVHVRELPLRARVVQDEDQRQPLPGGMPREARRAIEIIAQRACRLVGEREARQFMICRRGQFPQCREPRCTRGGFLGLKGRKVDGFCAGDCCEKGKGEKQEADHWRADIGNEGIQLQPRLHFTAGARRRGVCFTGVLWSCRALLVQVSVQTFPCAVRRRRCRSRVSSMSRGHSPRRRSRLRDRAAARARR